MLSNRPIVDVAFVAATSASAWALVSAVNTSKSKGTPFAAHPIAAAVGFSLVAASSYIMASPRRRSITLVYAHQAAMFAGTGALYYALWQVWQVKDAYKKKHIQTPHSYFGVAAIGLLTLLSLNTTYFYLTVKDQAERNKGFKKHKTAGKVAGLIFTLALVSGTLSFTKDKVARATIVGSAIASMGLVVFSAIAK